MYPLRKTPNSMRYLRVRPTVAPPQDNSVHSNVIWRRLATRRGTVFDLSGRTALVTGAGQNVGAGIARALATQGATVVVNDVVAARAEATASTIREGGGSAGTAVFDVTDLADVESA